MDWDRPLHARDAPYALNEHLGMLVCGIFSRGRLFTTVDRLLLSGGWIRVTASSCEGTTRIADGSAN